tara:strand:+ start:5906 stop:6307 length:402 start_codon:yes stop_codon:yes gene_type:complete
VILSNGIDIVDIRRIKKTIDRFGDKFKKRCFSSDEILKSEMRKKLVESYAKRYAAKEACAKALGTGLARGVFWRDIEIYNNKYGKPKIKLYNKALKFLKKIQHKSNCSIEVSLTDEANYAIANVIIYENKKTK